MASADETLVAAAAVLQNLARDESIPGSSSPPFDFQLANGTKSAKLPGENSPAKEAFEAELEALVRRVHHLEFQAVSHHNFQQQADPYQTTPSAEETNERNFLRTFGLSRLSSGQDSDSLSQQQKAIPVPADEPPLGEIDDESDDEDDNGTRVVREEDISFLRNHVQKQAEEISSQKDIIAQVRDELQKQEEHTRRALTKVENEDVVLLERELRKHQQANEAFQKALREIGGIITQVANGDLSMKVQIHPLEMDPEIATLSLIHI